MFLGAAASRQFCSLTRRSVDAPSRLMLKMAVATLAMAVARDVGETVHASIRRVGSGIISIARIAMKWCETMANVSRRAAAAVHILLCRRRSVNIAAIPNSIPATIEAATRVGSQ